MKFNANFQNATALEQIRVALLNAESHPEIAKALEDIGYGTDFLKEGNQLLSEARQTFSTNLSGKDLKKVYYDNFAAAKAALSLIYEGHARKVSLLYVDKPAMADLLAISGNLPTIYVKRMEAIRKFYNEAMSDQNIQADLAKVKITQEELDLGLAKIAEVEAARAEYIKHKGNAQDSTFTKDAVFEKLSKWTRTFYAAAKISLSNNPQLVESLSKVVKS